ncbi:MAG: hypothetical protein ACPGN3_11260 [Opitutales bacterium]
MFRLVFSTFTISLFLLLADTGLAQRTSVTDLFSDVTSSGSSGSSGTSSSGSSSGSFTSGSVGSAAAPSSPNTSTPVTPGPPTDPSITSVNYPIGFESLPGASDWAIAEGLGAYYYENDPWIYIENMGYMYLLSVESDLSPVGYGIAAWIYSPDIGRFWWSHDTGPYIYLYATESWAYIEGDAETKTPWLYNFDGDEWQIPTRPQQHFDSFDAEALILATASESDDTVTITRFVETREGLNFEGDIETSVSDSGVTGTLYMSFKLSIDPADFNAFLISMTVDSFESNLGTFRPSDFSPSDPGFPELTEVSIRINDDGITGTYVAVIYLTDGTSIEETGTF